MSWAVVTGGSRGIGAAACLALARAGHDIAFTYRDDSAAAQRVQDQITRTGRRARCSRLDAGDVPAVAEWAAELAAELSPQVVVANAGETFRGHLAEHTTTVVQRLFDVNVVAPIEMARAFAPALGTSGAGALITVSSINGLRGSAASVAYSSTKAAILGMTRALAVELAPAVRVNAVVPGIIDTDMNSGPLGDPDIAATVEKSIPLARPGTPQELGDVIAWLAGPTASYVTGTAIAVDGGGLARFPVH